MLTNKKSIWADQGSSISSKWAVVQVGCEYILKYLLNKCHSRLSTMIFASGLGPAGTLNIGLSWILILKLENTYLRKFKQNYSDKKNVLLYFFSQTLPYSWGTDAIAANGCHLTLPVKFIRVNLLGMEILLNIELNSKYHITETVFHFFSISQRHTAL